MAAGGAGRCGAERDGMGRQGTAAPGLGGASFLRQPELRGAGPALRGSSPPHAPLRAPPRGPGAARGSGFASGLPSSFSHAAEAARFRGCPPPVGKVTFRFASPPIRCANRFRYSPLPYGPFLCTKGEEMCVFGVGGGPLRASFVRVWAGAERPQPCEESGPKGRLRVSGAE